MPRLILMSWQNNTANNNQIQTTRLMCYKFRLNMKKNMTITIDATQGADKFWADINEAHNAIMKANKPSLWQRIKSWF